MNPLSALLDSSAARRQAAVLALLAVTGAFAFLLLGVSPLVMLAASVAAAVTLVSLVHPRAAIGLLVFSFFFGQQVSNVTFVQALGALAMSVGMVFAFIRREPLRMGHLFPWFCAWAGWIACSYMYGQDPALVTVELRKFITNVAIYALVFHYLKSWRQVHGMMLGIYAAIQINAVVAVVQGIQNYGVRGFRASGIFHDENYLGSLCVAAVGISAVEFWHASGVLRRLAWLSAGLVSLMAMLFTASRTAHIALLSLGAFLFVVLPERRRLVVGVAAALALLFPYAPGVYRERIRELGEEVARSLPGEAGREKSVRGYLFDAGFRIWRDHPVLGAGVGSFRSLVLTVGYNPGIGWERGYTPHNAYIGLLAETGAIGLGIYALLLLVACRGHVRALLLARARSDVDRCTALGVSILMLVHLVMTLTIPVLGAHSFFVALAAGAILSERRDEKEEDVLCGR